MQLAKSLGRLGAKREFHASQRFNGNTWAVNERNGLKAERREPSGGNANKFSKSPDGSRHDRFRSTQLESQQMVLGTCRRYSLAFAMCLGFLATTVGCGSTTGPDTLKVTGVVTLDGDPVERALVVFTPKATGEDSQLAAQAETDPEGRFELSTYQGGSDYKQGIVAGEYGVSITKLEVVQDMRKKPKHLLPRKYSQPKTSKLTATVAEGGDNVFDFDLKK